MQKSKFHNCFQELDKKEQKEFKHYLFANHAQKMVAIRVFEYYYAATVVEKTIELSKEKAFAIIFKEEECYNYRKISDALSDLYLLLEEFLLWKEIKNPQLPERDLMLLEVFRKRNMNQQLPSKIKEYRKKLNQQKERDMWYYLSKMKLSHFEYFFSNSRSIVERKGQILESIIYLDDFFITGKLEYATELKSREAILQEQHEIDFLEEVLIRVPKYEQTDNFIQLYYAFFFLHKKQEVSQYFEVRKLFLDNFECITKSEQIKIISYLINFCAWEIKKGNNRFIKEAFETYKFSIKRGILISGNFLTPNRFHNIVNIACYLKEYSWAEKFTLKWATYLDVKIRKSAVATVNARLHFEQNQFEETIKMLQEVVFSDIYYTVRARLLLLRSYVELKENSEFIFNQCNSFIVFVRRNKTFNLTTQKTYLNFAKAIKILAAWKFQKGKAMKKIQMLHPMAHEKWILEKLNKLM